MSRKPQIVSAWILVAFALAISGGCGSLAGPECHDSITGQECQSPDACQNEDTACGPNEVGWCLQHLVRDCVEMFVVSISIFDEVEVLEQEGFFLGEGCGSSSGECDEANAFQHIYWQCALTHLGGADLARGVGDAKEVGGCQRGSRASDTTRDLHNNVIGRELGLGALSVDDCFAAALEVVRRNPPLAIIDDQDPEIEPNFPPAINCE